MHRIIFFFGIFCFSLDSSLSAKIIEASHLEEVNEYFDNLDSQSLVMWDVDHTLITPADPILQIGNESITREIYQRYLGNKTNENKKELISRIFSRLPYCLVDSRLPHLISSLQDKGIPTMAFTAMKTGSFGVISSMEHWRFHQLKKVNIDFSDFFPMYSGLNWQVTSPKAGSPAFRSGILCSDHLDKGPVLDKFLQEIAWKPTQVIFFDDTLACLTSVENTLRALNIPFVGIHYHAAEAHITPIDPEIAHRKYLTLVEKGIWLTDEEARLELQPIAGEAKNP